MRPARDATQYGAACRLLLAGFRLGGGLGGGLGRFGHDHRPCKERRGGLTRVESLGTRRNADAAVRL